MKVYESDKIRNIVILGHSGCGKTNLTESILYTNNLVNRISKPSNQVNMTSTLNLIPVEWNNHKYNFLDTPGYFDFYGEVVSSIRAAAGSIIIVDGTCDIQVGTDKALEITDENNTPRFIFVNKIDSEKADYNKVLEQLRERYGKKIAPFHIPMGKDKEFKGFINVVDMFARKYDGKNCIKVEIPEYMKDSINPVREMLLESVAESDDKLLDKYFAGEEFTIDEIHKGLRQGVISGDIIPVLCGSTAKNIGIHTLLDMIWDYMPSPIDIGYDNKESEFSGIVFKTLVDPFIGKVSLVKVCEGELTPDTEIYNINKGKKEKIYHLYTLRNKEQIEIEKAVAGDIVVLTKLSDVQTGDTLSTKPDRNSFENIDFPKPQIYFAIEPLNKGDEEKISTGLHRLIEEDPSFTWYRNHETKQTLIGGQGEIHINSIKDKLKEKFGIDVKLSDLKVAYRETIKGKSDVQGKHKKQSGGHGQYGDVKIVFEPSEEEFLFEEKIFGGSVPKQYIPAVEKGLKESLQSGVLAGFPVMNVKATLYDGSYHDVDSSEMAFKIASSIAFKKGMESANPVLLEPIMNLKIVVPEEYMGDIIGDINKRRGRIIGMEPSSRGKQIIYAQAPQAETFRYAIDLRSMTQGRGYFEMEFERYEEVPAQIMDKIIEEVKNNK
ncbi:elongation factor G [Tepidibacter formicigenes]|jgi:elongation factor G|uniref:Elongation factor G n=1 Tax=Tepidibacter formicigenes DSM 15518 TaxID=1123349 RepID=A0A1M6QM87_9FIRM|nr:elongation factor G [Tepidibacter formicigenes]SHK21364.1 elongation factor G [Tepidibacter formicigenes DSM 15518]